MVNTNQIVTVLVGSAFLIIGTALWYNYQQGSSASQVLNTQNGEITSPRTPEAQQTYQAQITTMDNPIARFTTKYGQIDIELFADQMPITVDNFVSLAQDGFYDNTKFHRVIPGFMIQGGDPNTRDEDASLYGTGGPGYTIQDEFIAGELLTNVRGTIAMANTGQPNSGGSQFFINVADNTNLDYDKPPLTSQHPVFGRVIAGMEIVDEIEIVPTGARDIPLEPVVIESVQILTSEDL